MQAAVLLCQSMWGPRWFVPKRFLPAKYDYHRPVVPREVAEGALDSSSGPADVETGDGGTFTGSCCTLLSLRLAWREALGRLQQLLYVLTTVFISSSGVCAWYQEAAVLWLVMFLQLCCDSDFVADDLLVAE